MSKASPVIAAPAAGAREAKKIWWEARAREAGCDSLAALQAELELPAYRLNQIYRAAAKELQAGVKEVSVLPLALRAKLASMLKFSSVTLSHEVTSGDGQTTKFLFELAGGQQVEAVLMRHRGGRTTACISSQAGCALRCDFCA
ncbi:MAG TPA: hypothetical protein VN860_01285, partial [Candidatus Acidoferrales bacterium]|nr:hypothetical protein [Candidatus Acidoferrales bacterium]